MKRALRAITIVAGISLLVQCPTPWHKFENPVDEDSPTYIGLPSIDHNGDGIPQYIDVEELELVAPEPGACSPR